MGKEDPTLKERIVVEAPGIAVWAIAGLLRLRETGEFTTPTSCAAVVEDFRKQSSPITEFVDDQCVFVEKGHYPANMMYDAYVRWCKEQSIVAGTRARFIQRIGTLYPGCHVEKIEYNGEIMGCLTSISLTPTAIERYLMGR